MEGVKPHPFVLAALLATLAVWPSAAFGFGAEGTSRPRLSLADEAPLVVAGRGFKARERVRVVASVARGAYRKTVLASRRGRFTVRFASADASCGPVYVAAYGRDGSRASFRRPGIPPPCGPDPG
jgi:hypothetical protein